MPIFKVLERTPGILRDLIAQAAPEDWNWQPRADRWSISMVLAHLADVEVNGFMSRFRDILNFENPFLPSYDQLALFQNGNTFDARTELDRFASLRIETLAWLKAAPADAGARAGRHEQLGAITFSQLLHEFAFHDLGHIRQVMELYRAHAFYPNMGVFQNYYSINP